MRPGFLCRVAQAFDHYPDIADELRAALASEIQAAALSRALQRRGIDIPQGTLTRHRRGECRCP